jgi:hypothetical protein
MWPNQLSMTKNHFTESAVREGILLQCKIHLSIKDLVLLNKYVADITPKF